MIVLDASAWVRALVAPDAAGDKARAILADSRGLCAPTHAPLEVLQTLRRYEVTGLITPPALSGLLDSVLNTGVRYFGATLWLLDMTWNIRHNVSLHDAPYVAIAQALEIPLVTADAGLATTSEKLGVQTVVV